MGRPEEQKEKKKRNYRIHFNFAAGKQPVEFNELVRTHPLALLPRQGQANREVSSTR